MRTAKRSFKKTRERKTPTPPSPKKSQTRNIARAILSDASSESDEGVTENMFPHTQARRRTLFDSTVASHARTHRVPPSRAQLTRIRKQVRASIPEPNSFESDSEFDKKMYEDSPPTKSTNRRPYMITPYTKNKKTKPIPELFREHIAFLHREQHNVRLQLYKLKHSHKNSPSEQARLHKKLNLIDAKLKAAERKKAFFEIRDTSGVIQQYIKN